MIYQAGEPHDLGPTPAQLDRMREAGDERLRELVTAMREKYHTDVFFHHRVQLAAQAADQAVGFRLNDEGMVAAKLAAGIAILLAERHEGEEQEP